MFNSYLLMHTFLLLEELNSYVIAKSIRENVWNTV